MAAAFRVGKFRYLAAPKRRYVSTVSLPRSSNSNVSLVWNLKNGESYSENGQKNGINKIAPVQGEMSRHRRDRGVVSLCQAQI